jgi:iron complex outermembrane receptor protein
VKEKSVFPLLFCGTLAMHAAHAETELITDNQFAQAAVIVVEPKAIKNVSVNEVKSADLADVLVKKISSISLVRRSGIANDIILRGQKKDNINVLIDNAKIYGACPNRMDPPTSHILTNNIEDIEIIDGPYDVENFGTLSGAIKVTTKMPEPGLQGDVSLNLGSWDYQKFAANISGGSERIRAMLSLSEESGGQYEDGDGNDFSEQIENFTAGMMLMPPMNPNYKPEYKDLDAFKKSTLMGKLYAFLADNQEMEFSYTANRSDDILYPSSKMDALYDDSDIINLNYRVLDLGQYSDKLELQVYNSKVEHPMSTFYRVSSGTDSVNERISYLETETQGAKLINSMDLSDNVRLKAGIDLSERNWDGEYEGFGTSAGITGIVSIPDVNTSNSALFAELTSTYENYSFKYGVRLDDTEITTADNTLNDNDYSGASAFIYADYKLNDNSKLFGGIGRASRVPDARELYFRSAMGGGMLIGNPDLDETTNNEIDLGIEKQFSNLTLKTRLFYSALDNFIHYNASKTMRRFENVDASIYGLDIRGSYIISDKVDVDFGLAYQRGKKDEALAGQTDKDLAEIPPMKTNVALSYKYRKNSFASFEVVAADSWDNYDADNGEQELDSWATMNVKVKHQISQQISITAGIDNLFDETYAMSNTYKDLTLLADGSGDVILMNEPGRYFYLNGTYSF